MERQQRRRGSRRRMQIGNYWLWYRSQRKDWCICWLEGRTTRRVSTGITGGSSDHPPVEAQQALAAYLLDHGRLAVEQPPNSVLVDDITRRWLKDYVSELHDPARYANSVLHWQRYFAAERAAGRLADPLTVDAVTKDLIRGFVAFRQAEGKSPPTISRDIAALRGPINWALKENVINAAPRIMDIKGKHRRREIEYSPEQVAALLEAAWSRPDRRHVHLFILIALSTHGRTSAILELDAVQVRKGLIFFNAPGREQTRKRRSVVPIVPTLLRKHPVTLPITHKSSLA